MKVKFLIMAMMIVSGMCSCTAQNGENGEPGCDVFKTQSGTTVKMYCIKHGSLRMQVGDKWVYVDPVTTAVKPETDYSTLPKADYILVTHEHFDHLDSVAINQLNKEGTMLITNARCHEILGGQGVVMKNGDHLELPDELFTHVEAVPAYNNSPEKLQFHPKGRDNGFVLTIEGMRIYIAGDTEDIPEMAEIKDIDVAFLPCNLPYTMTPEQCAHAAQMIKPVVLFPYHYGQTDIQQVVKLLEGSGIDVRIRDYQ
jgi:L-ascorbate metabolism protein UlaG (beta-lactamase superfamily)